MAQERTQRRLAAIMAADVVGYSRLVERDEKGTLAALKERRKNILLPLLAQHHGRVVKVMGDGVLVEFASAVNAVACAAELQDQMAAANRDLTADERIVLRIGINLGDVVVDGGDLYGDGVIIAVRLQAMALPGGICLAGSVREQLGEKLPLTFEDLGPCELKNIARPIRAFQVLTSGPEAIPRPIPPASAKPSVAILPFTNLSDDPAQQYFSDGVTEDIITELSRFRSLLVVARNSSFQYRDKAVDVRRIGRELGVQYLVEGSVRKAGDQVRITVQLIEAAAGNHVWSERYDRSLADIFAIQDEVVQGIVARLAGQLATVGWEHARRKRTEHLGAYDCYLRGLECWRYNNSEASAEGKRWFKKALELDPGYGEPLARLSIGDAVSAVYNDSPDRFEPALAMANRAVALDPNNSWSHCALAMARLFSGAGAAAAEHFESAMRLNPNDPDQTMFYAGYQVYSANLDAAQSAVAVALRLNPLPPVWYHTPRGMLEYALHHYATAARLFEDPECNTNFWHSYYLAACYEQLGRTQDAKREMARAFDRKPNLNAEIIARTEPYVRPGDLEHLIAPLRKLGLPD
jgi:adenylate cyclase